jgi:multiple sugar transport system ATP-binding protein
VLLSGIVEHVEYQGHESLVHLNTGARPAVVPELEAAKPVTRPPRQRAAAKRGAGLGRLIQRVAVLDRQPSAPPAAPTAELPPVQAGDLVVRTGPDLFLRPGERVPLLVDLAHLYVFDHEGRRICPAPAEAPRLE